MLSKVLKRKRRQAKIRSTISGTASLPRLCVFRSNKEISAQIIDDVAGTVICSASSLKLKDSGTKSEVSKKVGEEIAQKAKDLKLDAVVFDRGGFLYHGRVKAFADGARSAGLKF